MFTRSLYKQQKNPAYYGSEIIPHSYDLYTLKGKGLPRAISFLCCKILVVLEFLQGPCNFGKKGWGSTVKRKIKKEKYSIGIY